MTREIAILQCVGYTRLVPAPAAADERHHVILTGSHIDRVRLYILRIDDLGTFQVAMPGEHSPVIDVWRWTSALGWSVVCTVPKPPGFDDTPADDDPRLGHQVRMAGRIITEIFHT